MRQGAAVRPEFWSWPVNSFDFFNFLAPVALPETTGKIDICFYLSVPVGEGPDLPTLFENW